LIGFGTSAKGPRRRARRMLIAFSGKRPMLAEIHDPYLWETQVLVAKHLEAMKARA